MPGQNLASLTTQPTTIPLPSLVNGTTVLVGGLPAPMYYVSPGQINAQIPFELQPGQQYQVIVSANGALTTPDSIQLSAAAPGLAAFGDGTLIAQHSDGSLVSTTSPAKSGEYLVAYLAGLGDTNVNLASGASRLLAAGDPDGYPGAQHQRWAISSAVRGADAGSGGALPDELPGADGAAGGADYDCAHAGRGVK